VGAELFHVDGWAGRGTDGETDRHADRQKFKYDEDNS